MKADYHVHSEFSDDSSYPMEEAVQDAISLGLDEICFTDHVDYGIKKDHPDQKQDLSAADGTFFNVDNPEYFRKIEELQKKYKGQIRIRKGLELGVQSHTVNDNRKLTEKYPLDFAILSIHQIGNQEFWTGDFQKGRSQQEYNEAYYLEMLRVVRSFKNYSVLGHMDLIVRYDPAGVYPFEKVQPLIQEILKTVIEDGKGIELNTSWIRYGLSDTQPSEDILKLYRRLGGTIITIGSDSHQKEHLGMAIEESKARLKELGFENWHTFENGKPIAHPL